MKQLTLKLQDDAHRSLKMIAAATGKTMTDLVTEWIESTKKTFFGEDKSSSSRILKILSSPVDESIPDRWTKAELDQMVKDDELTPEEHAAIDATLPKRKAKK